MAKFISQTRRDAWLVADTAVIGGGSLFQGYSGVQPTSGVAITSQVKLCEHVMGTPFAPTPTGGIRTATVPAVASVPALATGLIGFVRHTTSAGVFLADYPVQTGGAGTDVVIYNDLNTNIGINVQFLSMVTTALGG